ncbi:hypothetical protein QTH91_06865 [Variovorax dokdonensis]|uniref:Uncharacterized protein n=1 Tax=Variovorax dokdonensis TaxID=344883 RepID=A0ABT7N8C9_9BURK|nr:hypothetical protein [Variovorax dokdonensis]MDM0044198.1 hypothetical protein [Variovorax dokdonensis]
MTQRLRSTGACLVILAAGIVPAFAQTSGAGLAADAPMFANPVGEDTLVAYRGGAQVHNDMVLSGTTAENSARNVSTGSNAIDGGSFQNMSGLPVVIQNSGANVLIQNAVILNVQMN